MINHYKRNDFQSIATLIEEQLTKFIKRGVYRKGDLTFINKKIINLGDVNTDITINTNTQSVITINCTGSFNIDLDPSIVLYPDKSTTFFLQLLNAGDYTIGFNFPIEFPGGSLPAFTSGGKDWIGFLKNPGDPNWKCFSLGLDMRLP